MVTTAYFSYTIYILNTILRNKIKSRMKYKNIYPFSNLKKQL